jgi:Domain of unknown function (DUF4406)
MRLYVAGPMSGLEGNNYTAFRAAGDSLHAAGYKVLNPVDIDEAHAAFVETSGMACRVCQTGVHSWAWYMRQAVRLMLAADGVATLPEWQHSHGAITEIELAQTLEMPVYTHHVWIKHAIEAREQWDSLGAVFL